MSCVLYFTSRLGIQAGSEQVHGKWSGNGDGGSRLRCSGDFSVEKYPNMQKI
jgi:hypothetical protein